MVVAVVLSAVLNAARVSNGTDITSQSDYFADLGAPAVEPALDTSRPIH